MNEILAHASRLTKSGLSVIPIRPDGTKAPDLLTWKPFQDEIADPSTLENWFESGTNGLAVIGGAVSGNLEILDFDDPETAKEFGKLVEQEGRTELVKRLPLVRTPTGGVHVYYRCQSTVEGNLKLARKIGPGGGPGDILIETRGEGGYVLAPGSPAKCHELEKPYELIRGDLGNIPTITADERDFLFNTARSLNEYVKPPKQFSGSSSSVGDDDRGHDDRHGDRPGDRFNATATWREVLEPHGWVVDHQQGEETHWRRPGKNKGSSATTNCEGSGLFHCFSSNGHPFEAGDSYEKFTAYTLLNHGGDFKEATLELVKQGYGSPEGTRQDGVERGGARDEVTPEIEPLNKLEPNGKRGAGEVAGWKLWDLGDVEEWPAPQLEWIVEPLIPKGGIGFLSGAPKDGKSLLAVDLTIHLAHSVSVGRDWMGKFSCDKSKVLYIAREDPIRRIRERAIEITNSYGLGVPPHDSIYFLIRERFNLMDRKHISWLYDQVQKNGIDFLILDVLNRMIPDLDELSAKDMAKMVSVIEELNRELDLTILLLDHTRKPIGPGSTRNKQEPNPFDLKGSVAKYGAADFMLCMSRDAQDGRLHVYSENKDTDERPHFLIDVSPKGSGEPKFTYAGDIEQLSSDMKAIGIANQGKVLEALEEGRWLSPSEIASRTPVSRSTVGKHLKTLEAEQRVQRTGEGRNTKWRRVSTEVVQGSFGSNAGDTDE